MNRVAMLPLLLGVLPLLALPAGAQQNMGHAGTGIGHTGNGIGRTMPMQTGGRQFNTGQFNPFRPNAYGANSGAAPPPPSWEIPRVSTPHWEIPSYIPVQPNPVQGNHVNRGHRARGVGFVGIPYYYADPFAFADADMDYTGDQQQQPPAQAQPEYGPQQEYPGPNDYGPEEYPAARPPYNPQAYAAPAPQGTGNGAADDGLDHPEVTLVFKDGRPPLKVHSYVLTGSSVFVAEHGHQRVIPLSELDLPATVSQNRDAGVDFVLPGAAK